jgi:hypothetical protein
MAVVVEDVVGAAAGLVGSCPLAEEEDDGGFYAT